MLENKLILARNFEKKREDDLYQTIELQIDQMLEDEKSAQTWLTSTKNETRET